MDTIERLVDKYPDLIACAQEIRKAYVMLEKCFAAGKKLLLCGNGGSAADSEHIVGELMKGYFLKRSLPVELRAKLLAQYPAEGVYLADHLQGALPAISLVSQTSLMTAFINDVAADMVYAQQVYGYGAAGDVLLGLSTSGNSANVLNAIKVGRTLGLHTLGLTGAQGGAMADLCEVAIRVPWQATPDIQESHRAIYHALCGQLEEHFFS